MYSTLTIAVEENIFLITVNRPDKLNALNWEVLNELGKAFDEAEHNSEVRSVLITGQGAKAFVAGADIAEFKGKSKSEGEALAKTGQDLFARIEAFGKPVAAAVNGFALGGGCELAMACHFRVASANAKFGQPEVNLGLIPGYGGTQRLTQLIGKGRALELLMTGAMIDAQRAWECGLVNYVVPAEELLQKAKSLLRLTHEKAPLALAGCIRAANNAFAPGGFEAERKEFGECFGTKDMEEGVAAFLEKRKPQFTGA